MDIGTIIAWCAANPVVGGPIVAVLLGALAFVARDIYGRVFPPKKTPPISAATPKALATSPAVESPHPAETEPRDESPTGSSDPLEAHRNTLRAAHRCPPSLFARQVEDLNTVYVELDIERGEADAAMESRRGGFSEKRTLRGLLEEERLEPALANRWVVLGDPGAGKSTLARHLVYQQANAREGAVPVYAPLARLAVEGEHPFDIAEADACASEGKARGAGVAHALFELAKQQDGVWLLLDGLDEVAPGHRGRLRERLNQWATKLLQVTIAVFSRPIGYQPLGGGYSHQARVRRLTLHMQQELLSKWLGGEAERVWEQLERRKTLLEACEVPLLLSQLAYLFKTSGGAEALPVSRLQLFQRSSEVLLERGQNHLEVAGVRNKDAARSVLGGIEPVATGAGGGVLGAGHPERAALGSPEYRRSRDPETPRQWRHVARRGRFSAGHRQKLRAVGSPRWRAEPLAVPAPPVR